MFFDDLAPLRNPVGFGATDFIELSLAVLLVALAFAWRGRLPRLAHKTAWCMLALAILPIALRLLLIPHHPIPTPDLYDEFGHLLMADTLRHARLANPPHPLHQFFETFFVLQQPTYSSIYPIGNGLALAFGWIVFGTPWAGVLLCTSAFCALCYWVLRAWVAPEWALLGGLLAVFEFGPLNQWTNNYWGGAFSAAAGCLVFGALPRLRQNQRLRDAILLGLGLALHLLSRPYESVFLFVAMALFLPPRRSLAVAALIVLPALGLTALQNKKVTGNWTQLPYALSQYQYGVPAALTFQSTPIPHNQLTPEQALDYRMQSNFHPGKDTLASYFARLFYRTRYYRFYFYAPLYIALVFFLFTIRTYRWAWVPLTCLLFALGINFFPAFQFHYLAAVVCLFILMSVKGLERLNPEAARLLAGLCAAQFIFFYGLHLSDSPALLRYDLWDSINHRNPERRLEVARQLNAMPGQLLVFVRYWPQHVFQDEWVYNGADIDTQRIVWARDLGDTENEKLLHYYPNRKPLLLEPDARPPQLDKYEPASPEPATEAPPALREKTPGKKPLIQFEDVP